MNKIGRRQKELEGGWGENDSLLNETCCHGKGSALVDIVGPTGLNPTARSLSDIDLQ